MSLIHMGTVLGFNMDFEKYEKYWKSSSVSFISATRMHLNIGSKRSPDQCPKGLVQPILVVDCCKLKDNKLMFGQISIDKTDAGGSITIVLRSLLCQRTPRQQAFLNLRTPGACCFVPHSCHFVPSRSPTTGPCSPF